MKYIVTCSLLLTICHLAYSTNRDMPPLTLEADILEIVDGFQLGVNGNTVGMIMRLRLDLNKRRFGKTPSGIVGFYTFENKKYSLSELVNLEAQLTKSNSTAHQKEREALQKLLPSIINDFLDLTKPFLADARGAKGQMLVLIGEWSQKAHRNDSHLLEWANVKEGSESNAISTKLTTFFLFDQFVEDLIYFLETLLRSCPKACAQFKEMMEKQKDHQTQPHK